MAIQFKEVLAPTFVARVDRAMALHILDKAHEALSKKTLAKLKRVSKK